VVIQDGVAGIVFRRFNAQRNGVAATALVWVAILACQARVVTLVGEAEASRDLVDLELATITEGGQ